MIWVYYLFLHPLHLVVLDNGRTGPEAVQQNAIDHVRGPAQDAQLGNHKRELVGQKYGRPKGGHGKKIRQRLQLVVGRQQQVPSVVQNTERRVGDIQETVLGDNAKIRQHFTNG